MSTSAIRRPKLRVSAFVQRDGTVRVGWDPDRSYILTPPPRVAPKVLLDILGQLDGAHSRAHVVWFGCTVGLTGNSMSTLLAELDEAGLLSEGVLPSTDGAASSVMTVHILGRGPLSDAVAAGLTPSSALVVVRSSVAPAQLLTVDDTGWLCDIVVLADDMAPDPRVVTSLVRSRTPHLQVRIRDGKGIVGPFVEPGNTSCLRCAELIRCSLDPQWPHVSAQLLGRVGEATKPTVLATAAVALAQIEAFVAGHDAALRDRSLELDLVAHTMDSRHWVRHPGCDCALV
ncbi:TOMM precursor leader peptide-binding protein [Rhodococcus sp. PAMC28707]|uniref:TOMM precursor leader peptide-binding protein n=1 Tax=unclassified Rhodococcus (in: high G+C Gram-positive bacteria) TaxID=192944 RepID=UPI00109D8819|nr:MULTISPECIES: TOMM precursor leader peptide-binding protein [unclassified Rhodococcus (in: high G+C Gram-positive bacteria)]QCB50722.1 TOMM precursor leader peptide-binding protein [Rhodococcus sp. PAMC28705]QCB57586.1 TOMM precursor leader peptide-binding protein [Rhodococcus sp. PAMC28707]